MFFSCLAQGSTTCSLMSRNNLPARCGSRGASRIADPLGTLHDPCTTCSRSFSSVTSRAMKTQRADTAFLSARWNSFHSEGFFVCWTIRPTLSWIDCSESFHSGPIRTWNIISRGRLGFMVSHSCFGCESGAWSGYPGELQRCVYDSLEICYAWE